MRNLARAEVIAVLPYSFQVSGTRDPPTPIIISYDEMINSPMSEMAQVRTLPCLASLALLGPMYGRLLVTFGPLSEANNNKVHLDGP